MGLVRSRRRSRLVLERDLSLDCAGPGVLSSGFLQANSLIAGEEVVERRVLVHCVEEPRAFVTYLIQCLKMLDA